MKSFVKVAHSVFMLAPSILYAFLTELTLKDTMLPSSLIPKENALVALYVP